MKHNKIYEKIKDFIKNNYIDIIIIIVFFILAFVKLPYVVYRPGGALNVADKIQVDTDNKISGTYAMSYVSVSEGTIINVLSSYLIKDWDLVKKEDASYSDIDYDTSLKIEKLQYSNSIDIATYVAYTAAEKKIEILKEDVTVAVLDENANSDLQLLDKIITIDDQAFEKVTDVKEYINTLKEGDKVSIKVEDKDGNKKERYAYIYKYEDSLVMGVSLFVDYTFDTDPEVTFGANNGEAGSSGGFMMTLAVYDYLTEDDLSHGLNIMGTGTIDEEGNVGEIGGVKYKLLGAKKAGADIFFIPEDNYEEAKEVYDEYNLSFKLIKIANFNDAITYLNSISK